EHRRALVDAQAAAVPVIKAVGKEFGQKYGTAYDFIEPYKLDDADYAIVALGSTCGTTKVVIDQLRAAGQKVGLLKVRVFRPFPNEEIAQTLLGKKAVAVLDRSDVLGGFGGPVFTEVRAALYQKPNAPALCDYVYGLGGREIDMEMIGQVFADLKSGKAKPDGVQYLGVRD
ncbi:MAG TPA: transketolase C-terminal domain-containing protein, partial [Candidatus Edwardsbacteria bacterium]|nr:transketolase C-terminal domain-containing protein [Candidatus Edwardsbacteria bacterium]